MIVKINLEEKGIKRFQGNIQRKMRQSARKFDKMAGIIQRNIERNEGDRAFMSDDIDMINILANYRV
jgi:hypothetical protein